jgi:lipopolysaccharide/colanic/teichoic acid biosynthesis glycosyltransferase
VSEQQEVHELLPGLTDWAQLNGRDELSIPEKVKIQSAPTTLELKASTPNNFLTPSL